MKKSESSIKIKNWVEIRRFLGILGGQKSSKNKGNSTKNHGSGKAAFADGFLIVFEAFFDVIQAAKHCQNTVFLQLWS